MTKPRALTVMAIATVAIAWLSEILVGGIGCGLNERCYIQVNNSQAEICSGGRKICDWISYFIPIAERNNTVPIICAEAVVCREKGTSWLRKSKYRLVEG